MNDLTTIIVSALVGALVSAAGAVIQNALAARAKIDESLRADRIKVYKMLWRKTGLLPLWPRNENLTYKRLTKFSEHLRDWYFQHGGIFLSTQARKAYENLQNKLTETIQRKAGHEADKLDKDYDTIRDLCSAIRSELTNDLQSRKRAFAFDE